MAGHELVGYDLAFYCLDLTNTAHVRSLRVAHTTYTIYCQAEDREYEQLKKVFRGDDDHAPEQSQGPELHGLTVPGILLPRRVPSG